MRRSPLAPTADGPSPPMTPPNAPQPVEVLDGARLCRLRVWSDAEWAALPASCRPARFTRAPGLGWIGALPVAVMN